ncbi:TadE family type IV pilus minor pilin [Nocardioides jensenii]|uniref:TadE family type IV pilus minor pilin n=1 Tax=Nocardioides jensenii TaxID=1843 RepID=UPI0008303EE4|nr:TadE family type IV pilus minor pilin [Nocardioides jensenii]
MNRSERGAVTAETALALPLLVAVTLAMVWMLTFGVAQMKATDAAREAARALARGESRADAVALAQRVAPGAEVSVSQLGDMVVVVVTGSVPSPGGLLDAVSGSTHGEATALREEVNDVR